MPKLTHSRLQEVMEYSPDTGAFTWLKPTSHRVQVGDTAGVIANNGRRYIAIDGEKFMAHRLAWFYAYGEWPTGDVKQHDDNFDNCALTNLEAVSRSNTVLARGALATNTSGYRGVSKARGGKWQASITRNYKQINLGSGFETAEAASSAYETALLDLLQTDCEASNKEAADQISRRRRLRGAWAKIESGVHGWDSFDHFCRTVDDVNARREIVAVDSLSPVGPDNFRQSEAVHDFTTSEGRSAYMRMHRQENPERYRDRELQKNFNISTVEYDRMLAAQGGGCDICGGKENTIRNGRATHLAVDHNHETGAVRGILCSGCNKAIGNVREDVKTLENAIVYLRKHSLN